MLSVLMKLNALQVLVFSMHLDHRRDHHSTIPIPLLKRNPVNPICLVRNVANINMLKKKLFCKKKDELELLLYYPLFIII